MPKSFKVEVQADSTRQWSGNLLRFATEQEAEAYARDLWSRWSAVRQYRVVRVDEEPTDAWNFDAHHVGPIRQAVPVSPPALRVIDGGLS
jgi:hypothetical protein